jgi:hypothetical protein
MHEPKRAIIVVTDGDKDRLPLKDVRSKIEKCA